MKNGKVVKIAVFSARLLDPSRQRREDLRIAWIPGAFRADVPRPSLRSQYDDTVSH
jgi:hypothetical protein